MMAPPAGPTPPEGLVPGLPGRYYTDEDHFARERRLVFARSWQCVDRAEALAEPGRFLVYPAGDDSVLVIRGKDDRLRAFHNVCRHRGARLCTEETGATGALGKSVRCMYHGWSYALDGRLTAAPNLADLPPGAREQLGLVPVRAQEWLGYLWVNLDGQAPPLPETAGRRAAAVLGSPAKLDRYGVGALRRASSITYDVAANWKVITENFMECYHCAPLHPQLTAVLPQFASGYGTMTGAAPDGAAFAAGRGYSLSGRAAGPRLPGLEPGDGQLHALVLYPTAFLVLTPDHVAVYRLNPVSAGRTTLVVDTMFAPGHSESDDFDPDDTISLRDLTVRQDIEAVERCQLGMRSSAYQGVLVPAEHAIIGFYRDVLGSLGEPLPPAYEPG